MIYAIQGQVMFRAWNNRQQLQPRLVMNLQLFCQKELFYLPFAGTSSRAQMVSFPKEHITTPFWDERKKTTLKEALSNAQNDAARNFNIADMSAKSMLSWAMDIAWNSHCVSLEE